MVTLDSKQDEEDLTAAEWNAVLDKIQNALDDLQSRTLTANPEPGYTGPLLSLQVASVEKMRVNELGDITLLKGVAYAWPSVQGSANQVLTNDGSGNLSWATPAGGGGGGAPTTAQYLVLAADATLTNERVFTAGTGVSVTDGGAGGNYTVAFDATWGDARYAAAGHNHNATYAPIGSTYVTIANDATLTNERALAAGWGIALVDNGAGSSIQVALSSSTAGTGLTYTAGVLSWNGVGVQKAGAAQGTRRNLNFIEGSNVTITTTDNAGSDRVDITIAATGGGSSFDPATDPVLAMRN